MNGKTSAIAAAAVSLLVVIFFGAAMFVMLWRPVELSQHQTDLLNILLGAATAAFMTVVNYWLGSSVGSKAKDAALFGPVKDGTQP